MPRKIRELKADLRQAGFEELRRRGKGNHSYWEHPAVPAARVNLAGTDGGDAQHYQERAGAGCAGRPRAGSAGAAEAAMSTDPEQEITAEELAEARRYSMVIEWSDEDRVYLVSVPELPGLRTHGATHEEAVAMGEEAIATWLAGLRHFGHPVPPPRVVAGAH